MKDLHYDTGEKKSHFDKKAQVSYFYTKEGKILASTPYKNGLRHGDCKYFYPEGGLFSLQRYQAGLLHGTQEYFYPDGSLKTKLEYDQGKLVGKVNIYR